MDIEPAAELAPEQRELAEMAATEEAADRPDIAELLPVDRFGELLDLLPADALVAVAAEEELAPALRDYWEDVTTSFHDADAHHLYVAPERLEQALSERAALSLSSISGDQPHSFRAQAADTAARSLREAEPELEKLVRSGYRTVVAWSRRGEAERAAYNLDRVRAAFLDGKPAPHEPGVSFAAATLREGFLAPSLKLAILPEHRLLRRRRAERPAGPRTGSGALASFTDLRAGSPVVHEDHGIARFTGFETKTVGGVTRDYLELEYRDGDRVFVPSDQLHKISRYVGADAGDPPLSKLGGKQWEQMKLRARRAAEALAGELINLYAERKRRAGHAFPHDSEWQLEFEAAFPFRETPDQLEAIEAVRADMEEARPMDRLICGDVGYGKTEVALRAAFKAAADGKQVMFLVPTTVLAQQHFGTFTERLRDYPFRIEMASRFRSAKQTREALDGFTDGKVDILIGTHRLLSRDVRPKDLGLLIVDEEQRFGVKQKELLRQLRLRVDVMSLSATPIPRTLQMSLAGLRDISVIETPPEGRRPVKTYVGEYDEELVRAAIERELARGGQAFFLHNRVDTIDETAERVTGDVPDGPRDGGPRPDGREDAGERDARLPARRGRRSRVHHDRGVGPRHPQREHADRGARRRPRPGPALPDPRARGPVSRARLRLPALPLRGRADGGRRGAAVHAVRLHRAGIGLQDRHARPGDPRRGQPARATTSPATWRRWASSCTWPCSTTRWPLWPATPPTRRAEPVRVDLPVDAYVPGDYVPYEAAKIEVHRRVAGAKEVATLIMLREELEDRFGPVPEPLDNLIRIQDARIKLGRAGARSVDFAGGRLAVAPIDLDSRRVTLLRERLPEAVYESGRSTVRVRVPDEPAARFPAVVAAAEAILEAVSDPGPSRGQQRQTDSLPCGVAAPEPAPQPSAREAVRGARHSRLRNLSSI